LLKVNLTKSKDESVIEMLKNSVLASLDQAIGAFKYSRGRLKKLRKDFIDFDKQETANLAIAQLSDMISGKFKKCYK